MKMKSLVLLLSLFFVSASCMFAEDKAAAPDTVVYKIDRAHSSANFTVTHFKTPVRGSFSGITGDIVLDMNDPSESEVNQVIIPTTSINTNEKKRDEHMRTSYLDTGKFPQMRFQSASFKPKSKGLLKSFFKKKGDQAPQLPEKWVLVGNLEFMGKTRSVEIDVELLGEGPGMKGTYLTSWKGTTTLKRKQWGISFGPMDLIIGQDVEVELFIAAVRPYEDTDSKDEAQNEDAEEEEES